MPETDPESPSDERLVSQIHADSAAWKTAFPELMRRHRSALLRRCQARLANVHDAEDAVQETVLRVYRSLGDFKGQASFRTWLFAIADNQCHTLAQKRRRYVLSNHIGEIEDEAVPVCAGQDDAQFLVFGTLASLPAGSRDILMLRYYRELSLNEIACTLDVGLSAAKMRLYRALDQFAEGYERAREGAAA